MNWEDQVQNRDHSTSTMEDGASKWDWHALLECQCLPIMFYHVSEQHGLCVVVDQASWVLHMLSELLFIV